MNGEHPNHDLLQRFHDGDLSSAERAELHAHVQDCAGCAAQSARLARLNRLVAGEISEQVAAFDLSRMFDKIEAGIAAEEGTHANGVSDVISAAHGPNGSQPAQPTAAGTVVPLRRPSKARRFSSAAPALGALALAAAVMLMVTRPDAPAPGDDDELFDDAGGVSEVEDVEYGSDNPGDAIKVALSDDSSTSVVWIDDWDRDDEEE